MSIHFEEVQRTHTVRYTNTRLATPEANNGMRRRGRSQRLVYFGGTDDEAITLGVSAVGGSSPITLRMGLQRRWGSLNICGLVLFDDASMPVWYRR